jgi:hypothetical protein
LATRRRRQFNERRNDNILPAAEVSLFGRRCDVFHERERSSFGDVTHIELTGKPASLLIAAQNVRGTRLTNDC